MKQQALITGAANRVGRAMAMHLASRGWSVIIHYNQSDKQAIELADELSQKYPNQDFAVIRANLARTEEVVSLIENACQLSGNLELLINNASLFDPGHIFETGLELFDSQFVVNFRAPFILTRDFNYICKKGNIINIIDTRITSNRSDHAAYSLSKKALWELTQMAALEFAPGIRVNAIAPGVTLPPAHLDEEYLLNLARNIPMKKPGGLAPILKSLDFILDNDHLTGQLLFADGGENLGST